MQMFLFLPAKTIYAACADTEILLVGGGGGGGGIRTGWVRQNFTISKATIWKVEESAP